MQSPDPANIRAVLIVEGQDEHDVVLHLQDLHGIVGVRIEVLQGRGDLMNRVKQVAFDSAYRNVNRVGIVFDSEDDPQATRLELEGAVAYLNSLPQLSRTTHVLQLPASDKPGSFEALCLQAIAPNDDLLKCCDQFLACIEGTKHKLSTQARRDKARLLTWYVASTGKPISRIGRDAYRGDRAFDYTHPAFQPLVDFLQTLVE
jgi:hypothetical protein